MPEAFGALRARRETASPVERCSVSPERNYDSPLDEGIAPFVHALADAGVETFESCEGGAGHAYAEPTVRFHGDRAEGFRALAVAQKENLPVASLRRAWPILDNEPTGPWWELTFSGRA